MSRATSLRRIARLYSVVEEMHSVALRQATATVHEVERAICTERDSGVAAVAAARAALQGGERESWLLAQAEGEIFAVREGMLEAVKTRRVEIEASAHAEFVESRIRTEQMKQVVAQMVERAATEESRRVQAISDDRYAARRAWLARRQDRTLN